MVSARFACSIERGSRNSPDHGWLATIGRVRLSVKFILRAPFLGHFGSDWFTPAPDTTSADGFDFRPTVFTAITR